MTITSLAAAAARVSSRSLLHSPHQSAAALPYLRLRLRRSSRLLVVLPSRDSFSFPFSSVSGHASSRSPREGGGITTQLRWQHRDRHHDATFTHPPLHPSSTSGGSVLASGGRCVIDGGAASLVVHRSFSLSSSHEPSSGTAVGDDGDGVGTETGTGMKTGKDGGRLDGGEAGSALAPAMGNGRNDNSDGTAGCLVGDKEGGGAGTTDVASSSGRTSERDRLDARASAKLDALSEATRLASETSLALQNLNNEETTEDSSKRREHLLEELGERHRDLSRAYSQAIRYVARTRSRDAASDAEDLLHRMIARTGAPLTPNNIENYHPLLSLVRGDDPSKYGIRLPQLSSTFPPPCRSDFVNVLRAWSTSKVRQKGVRSEALLRRMAELAWWYPSRYGGVVPDSKCFSLAVKSFAGSTCRDSLNTIVRLHEAHDLLIERRQEREQHEHDPSSGLHMGNSRLLGSRDDPFLLMNSLAALKNYRREAEAELSTRWLDALHDSVMELIIGENVVVDPETAAAAEMETEGKVICGDDEEAATIATWSYIGEDGDDNNDKNGEDTRGECVKKTGWSNVDSNTSNIVVDLTATYTGVLRNHARARLRDSHVRAREVLDRMMHLRDITWATSTVSSTKCSAAASNTAGVRMEVRTNAYDLTISCLRNACSRQKRRGGKSINSLARDALSLLDEMISAWKEDIGNNFVGDNENGDVVSRRGDGGCDDVDDSFLTNEAGTTEDDARSDMATVSQEDMKADGGIPHPAESSFVFTLQALSHASAEEFIEDAERLLEDLELLYAREAREGESNCTPTPSSAAGYNAFLDMYIKWFEHDERLLPKVMEIIQNMEIMSSTMESMSSSSHVPGGGATADPPYGPDVTSWSHVLKACSFAQETERARALALAQSTFERLMEDEGRRRSVMTSDADDNVGGYVTDSCYFYMMNCVARLVEDVNKKESWSKDLFRDACRKGLVSANVLRALKSAVSDADFKEIVGEGRLPDHWVKNVTSVKAFYTDMTKGGDRKNARRKGKSTSGWAKKQKEREQKLFMKRAEKRRKRMERKRVKMDS